MKQYIKDGKFYKGHIKLNGRLIINPTEKQILEAGYIEYIAPEPNQKEIEYNNKINRIVELKQYLTDTDYQAIKFAEGELSIEEYNPIKLKRKAWREEINTIESELAKEGE